MKKSNEKIKFFLLFLIITLLIIPVKIVNASDTISSTYGDVNGDGKVTTTDVLQIKKHIVNLNGFKLDSDALLRADTNKDGNITTTDLLLIKRTLVGLNEESSTESNFETAFLKLNNNKENMIYSPLSIKYALSMLNEGADGNTKIQIENLIKGLSLTKYKSKDKVLSFANGIFIKDAFKDDVKEEYTNKLIADYNAEIKYDPFSTPDNINKWIEDKTLGIIKNMLKSEDINAATVMSLINALAIDMEWENMFEFSATRGADFKLANGDTMQATTMSKETSDTSTSYYIDEEITALTMDLKKYDDVQLEFMAIMPNSQELSDYISTFSTNSVENISRKLIKASETEAGIRIYIPKFAYNYDLKLKDNLKELGIIDVFDRLKADLSKISDESLFVSNALHKADIEFTEKGTKAAAVTVIILDITSSLPDLDRKEPIIVKFDKPFMYVIRDKETGEIWFIGTVYEPNNWETDKANYEKGFAE